MSLQTQLSALIVPSGTEFPGTVQELLQLIAQYEEITGLENFTGINFGPTTPGADNRDRPWFKTAGSGNPIGWYAWDGSDWVRIPLVIPSGPTADRPASPEPRTQYFDTDISVALIYTDGAWTTLAGSPGDVKHVKAPTIDEALTRNPGWIQDPDSLGRSIGGAGSGAGLTPRAYGEQLGEEETTLHLDNIPTHQHSTYVAQNLRFSATTGNGVAADGALAGWIDFQTGFTPDPGNDASENPIFNMPPTVYYWCLVKE